ncbi:Protein MAINTENANCE OF MERISTEMS [Cardamine amara subsp. amara]|uniref:Protein MAINTENANCE OF MERISTEMS n=1 Tax=Cardamine amara subsp. amara TaxID=228776 RepID=A0ABD1AS73_CARAN
MVFPTENSPLSSRKKSQLLKPHITSSSIDGSEAPQNLSASSPPDLKNLSFSVSFSGWRFTNTKFKSWARKMSALHEPIWRKAGIFEAIVASTHRIRKNADLVLGIAEKWCHDTKTFVFPWGETTITLEDVMVLLGFSVLGSPVFATLDSSEQKTVAKLGKECQMIKKDKVIFVRQIAWIERFMDSGDELEHVAFLVLWLSYFVFPARLYHIDEAIFPIAAHLSIGTKIALAPAVLAHLYAELSLLKNHIKACSESPIRVKLDLTGLFKLVLVWTWERFKKLQPKPNQLLKGEPRIARWSDLKQRTSSVRKILENSKIDSFEWRPYTKTLKNWDFPKFYPEKAMWVPVDPNLDDDFISFARCIKVCELVGLDSVEHYFPNRVATQFGMLQDVSCPVNQINLSKKAAWNDYNKPIDDLTLYIPSISVASCVTPMFCEWWTKQDVESAETSGSKMNRTSKDELNIAEDSTNKRCKYMKQAYENDESTKGHCQAQVQSDNDDEDDNLSIGQLVRLHKKKYSDVKNIGGAASEPLGKKSRFETDHNDSGPCQKFDLIGDAGDATLPLLEKEKMNERADETESQAYKSMVQGSSSDHSDCLLHDDGLGSEETMKSSEVSEDLELRNEDFGEDEVDIDITENRFQELKLLASSIEERINQAERNVAWLIERRAI